jgi:hypothetical protein
VRSALQLVLIVPSLANTSVYIAGMLVKTYGSLDLAPIKAYAHPMADKLYSIAQGSGRQATAHPPQQEACRSWS